MVRTSNECAMRTNGQPRNVQTNKVTESQSPIVIVIKPFNVLNKSATRYKCSAFFGLSAIILFLCNSDLPLACALIYVYAALYICISCWFVVFFIFISFNLTITFRLVQCTYCTRFTWHCNTFYINTPA